MGSTPIILAILETRHYEFHAVGTSEGHARAMLVEAWKTHAEETGADPTYIDEYIDDINYMSLIVGQVYRDMDDNYDLVSRVRKA